MQSTEGLESCHHSSTLRLTLVIAGILTFFFGPFASLGQAEFLACAPPDRKPALVVSDSRVERVTRRLKVVHPAMQTAAVHVIPHRAAGAFARQPNQIIVTSGLLRLTQSDDELAFVLGHELGHLQDAAEAELVGGVAHQELLADSFAISLAIAGGYDPRAGAHLIQRIATPENSFLTTMRVHAFQVQTQLMNGNTPNF